MQGTRFEFRFRLWIFLAIYVLGFTAPWDRLAANSQPADSPTGRVWSWLATQLFRAGWLTSQQAFIAVLAAAILLAAAGALLRVCGTAYLGAETMQGRSMRATEVVARGPYRHVRNPLYIGSWFTALAVAVLMPRTGGLFFVLAFTLFALRLIGGEEAHLAEFQGDAYLRYRSAVPRLLPRLRSGLAAGMPGAQPDLPPQWLRALGVEIYPLGIVVCFAIFGWTYDALLLTRCVIICFGVSLLVRAALPRGADGANAAPGLD